jgi:hypothetical protein
MVCSSLLPVVCRKARVLFVRLYNNTSALLQTTGGKDEQTIHEPSYKQLELKASKDYMSPQTNNWR